MQLIIKLIRKKKRKYLIAWRKKNRKKVKAQNKALWKKNKVKAAKYYMEHAEYITVRGHFYVIFKSKNPRYKSYKNMPFFDGWNPNKGGSFQAGADWIISNLGKRPQKASLHIVDHLLGFVPGNLEWTYPAKQTNQQMYKIIAQQRNRIKKLEEQIKELKRKRR